MPHKAALYDLISHQTGDAGEPGGTVKRALEVIRSHLGMEVAYVSEFVDGRSVFREVDAPGQEALIKPGDSFPLDDVYCKHIMEGRLPQIIPDTSKEEICMSLPVTKAVPVGSHISVPIRLPDGSTYGMFCCLGFEANHTLNDRDLNMMKAFADLAAFEIGREHEANKALADSLARIKNVIDVEEFSIVYQPIVNLESMRTIGLECLTRFSAKPPRTPDLWFNEAAQAGLGVDLELAAIRMAFAAFSSPLPEEIYLAVNASPATIMSDDFSAVFVGVTPKRVVLEITEHAHVENYDELLACLRPLRERGVRIAVDDAGAGYSSLQHILHLQPDIIKLDMALTRNIDIDPARRALASALIQFGHDTGSRIIAEGVETASELKTLKKLGAEKAQGYHLGKPLPLAKALELLPVKAKHRVNAA